MKRYQVSTPSPKTSTYINTLSIITNANKPMKPRYLKPVNMLTLSLALFATQAMQRQGIISVTSRQIRTNGWSSMIVWWVLLTLETYKPSVSAVPLPQPPHMTTNMIGIGRKHRRVRICWFMRKREATRLKWLWTEFMKISKLKRENKRQGRISSKPWISKKFWMQSERNQKKWQEEWMISKYKKKQELNTVKAKKRDFKLETIWQMSWVSLNKRAQLKKIPRLKRRNFYRKSKDR